MSLRTLAVLPFVVLFAFSLPRSPVDEPIELRLEPYVGPLFTVTADLGGKPGKLLFDTAGGFTVLTPRAAAAAGSTVFGRGTGFRHDGSRVDGRRGTPVALSFGAFTRRDEVGVLDLDAMLQGLPAIDGICSLETFRGGAVTIDVAHRRLLLESAASLAARIGTMQPLRMRVGHQAAGASLDVFVAVECRHGPLWFELDGGNTQGVLVAPHALADLGLPEKPAGAALDVELPITGLGKLSAKATVKEMIYDGLLDAGFFQRHVVTLDLAAGKAWVRAN